jgi:hypothetical protein
MPAILSFCLDTEGDAENPVLSLCWERFKRVGKLKKEKFMKKQFLDTFKNALISSELTKTITGGYGGSTSGSGGGTMCCSALNTQCTINCTSYEWHVLWWRTVLNRSCYSSCLTAPCNGSC